MKKLVLLLLTVAMIVAFAMPAAALESVFGGYWRTRAYTNQNFDGNDDEVRLDDKGVAYTGAKNELTRVDTRTRLFWTAILNDNLKFVNRFEFNGVWGDNGTLTATGYHPEDSWTDFGADGTKSLRIKQSYAEFSLGQLIGSVGVQNVKIARGFLFDDDAAGAVVTYDAGAVKIPFIWLKAYEGGSGFNSWDVDMYGVSPVFKAGIATLNPFAVYTYSENGSGWFYTKDFKEINLYHAGIDLSFKMDNFALWMLGIYQGGSVDLITPVGASRDVKAWLAAGGGKFDFGTGDVHGQVFYATGHDPKDKDITAFFVPGERYRGQYYAWSEIMGEGMFDAQWSAGSCGTRISNIFAANLGVTVKPMKKLAVTADVWFAQLAEDKNMSKTAVPKMEKDLGIEANLRLTYQLVQNLNLDLVGAYLFAGDAVYYGPGDADPYELGAQLSFSF